MRERIIAFCERRSVHIAACGLLGVMIAVIAVQMYGKAYREIGFDFTSYLQSARALLHGGHPYDTGSPFPYSYPLFLAFLMIPLAVIPYWLAVLLWYIVSWAALLVALCVLLGPALSVRGIPWTRALLPPAVLALLLQVGVLQNNFNNGQVNFLVLCLCALFIRWYFTGKSTVAAAALGAAAAIKLSPVVLLLLPLVRRDFKACLKSLAFFVGFCLLPLPLLGHDGFAVFGDYLRSFIGGKFSPGTGGGGQMHYSLAGLIGDLIPAAAGWPYLKLVGALVVAAGTSAIDGLAVRRGGNAGWWTVHLYLIAIVMAVPLSEKHHLALIIPGGTIGVLACLHGKLQRPQGWLLLGFFVSFYLGWALEGPISFLSLALLFVLISRETLRGEFCLPSR